FDQLRPGQLRPAEALVGGRDVLAVLPIGGGKSAIYDLAGLLRAGPTVVVSPLIALRDVRWAGTMSVAGGLEASEAETAREDEVERKRLTVMRRYADHTGCHRSFQPTYFGQDYPGPCGNYDNDIAPAKREQACTRSIRRVDE